MEIKIENGVFCGFFHEDGLRYSSRGNEDAKKEEACYENIVIPNGIQTIGKDAFHHKFIKSVVIPDSVTKIEPYAFAGSEIEEIIIPNSVKSIGQGCFANCKQLHSVTLSSKLKKLPKVLFWECTNLKKIQIPSGIKELGQQCFSDCESLEEVILPDSMEVIGIYCFSKCVSLKKINTPRNLTKIGAWAFECTSLEEYRIPETISKADDIGTSAFASDTIKKIYIPKRLIGSKIPVPNNWFVGSLKFKDETEVDISLFAEFMQVKEERIEVY